MHCLEVLSGKTNEERTLLQLRVNEGIILYAEDNTVEYPKNEETIIISGEQKCKWEIELEMEKNRFTLKFNNPREGITEQAVDYKYYVNVDRRQTIEFLKHKIAKEVIYLKKTTIAEYSERKDCFEKRRTSWNRNEKRSNSY